ncbi:interferon gamma receptor 1 isoform X3 [Dunckerocampus dactyliophorus]|uniref:interferon gamma receptor 1 isoform X3 n=1 Tax=Dunckerocampus dactyliophorus TaxID=161453 RepID=UPI002407524E|nr:interferon gamma receptor 1 isoform X3 [Dunckerocampus dactyliophorus]
MSSGSAHQRDSDVSQCAGQRGLGLWPRRGAHQVPGVCGKLRQVRPSRPRTFCCVPFVTLVFRLYLETVTTEHKCNNVSALVWDSLDSIMDVHYVTLTAAQGGHFSTNVSKTFTFNQLKMADVTCKLDFPPVDVRADDLGTVVSFPNPLRYYPELRQVTWRDAVHLDFTISPNGRDIPGLCQMEQETCRVHMLFPEGVDHCVTLTGSMSDRAGRYVEFQKTAPACLHQSDALEAMTLALLLTVLLIIISVIGVLIWKVRAWTTKITKEDLPKSLVRYPHATTVSHTCVKKTPKKPLNILSQRPSRILSKGDCNMDANCVVEMVSGVEEVRLISQSDEEDSDESTSTESVSIHPEDEGQVEDEHVEDVQEESVYDRTHVAVDLGDGDAAVGYTEGRR